MKMINFSSLISLSISSFSMGKSEVKTLKETSSKLFSNVQLFSALIFLESSTSFSDMVSYFSTESLHIQLKKIIIDLTRGVGNI